MLHPNDRRHLFESLRPPSGYALDCAIATTYTLDLLALLTVPVAFTSFDLISEDRQLTTNSHALLATLEQYAERISVFYHSGMIKTLKLNSPLLLSYLEKSLVQVSPPQGLFHPKIWVMRFVAENSPVLYRFLCLSRNLTYDQSWDTVLILDGQLQDKKVAATAPLSDFVRRLPSLSLYGTSDRIQAQVDLIQDELNSVEFERPAGFEALRFHPLGFENSVFPLTEPIDRLLMISPFVGDSGLKQLSQFGQDNILISRIEELDKLSAESRDRFSQIYQMNLAASLQTEEAEEELGHEPLSGLHAKLYVADAGRKARIWTGSANATRSAFKHNIEFLVELVGDKNTYGIDALLQSDQEQVSFKALLAPYVPPVSIQPDELEKVQRIAKELQDQLCKSRFIAKADPLDTAGEFSLSIYQSDRDFQIDSRLIVRCSPITRLELATEINPTSHILSAFAPLSCQALTPFFGFEILYEGQRLSAFVLQIPLQNEPIDRRQQILRSLLQDKTKILRFILFLLAEGKQDARELLTALSDELSGTDQTSSGRITKPILPMFEELVRALVRNPTKLDLIARIIRDLQHASPDDPLLPDEFNQIWEPIHLTHQKLKQ